MNIYIDPGVSPLPNEAQMIAKLCNHSKGQSSGAASWIAIYNCRNETRLFIETHGNRQTERVVKVLRASGSLCELATALDDSQMYIENVEMSHLFMVTH